MLIRSYGLFWKWDDVYLGGGPGNKGNLLGVPAANRTAEPTDFRDQRGVYALYADYELVYTGQNGSQGLLARLKQHANHRLAGRWNRFSWFGTRHVLTSNKLSKFNRAAYSTIAEVLDHIEGIMICIAEPPHNRQGSRFGDNVTQYLQSRDERLGPSEEQMIKAIYDKQMKSAK